MTPQQRALTEKQFTELAATGVNVDTLGWVALHAEALLPIEEHADCKVVLERVSAALRERERELRKKALGGGTRSRLGRHRKG